MTLRKTSSAIALSGFVLCLLLAAPALADSTSGTLFYVTFAPDGGKNVFTANYQFNGSTFSIVSGTNKAIADTAGADGIIFAPNGHLLIGGQDNVTPPAVLNGGSGKDIEITTSGAAVTSVTPGNPNNGAYHLALGPSATGTSTGQPVGTTMLYSLANNTPPPGGCSTACISATALNSGGLTGGAVQGQYSLSGDDTDIRGLAYDPANGKWYYGTSPDGTGNLPLGDFGTIVFNDLTHTAVTTKIAGNMFAHGLIYDPLSNTIISVAGQNIQQFSPTLGTLVPGSGLALGSTFENDQVSTDGAGHLVVSSNDGNVTFVDFDATKVINASDFHASVFLNGSLDDVVIAPAAVPEPSSLALVGTGLVLTARLWPKKKAGRHQEPSSN